MLHFILCLFGLVIGSFLNACIYRLPRQISIVYQQSFCPFCHQQLSCWQNIPLISYILLKGKCYHCKNHISWQYPLIEIITLLITVLLLHKFHFSRHLLFHLIFIYGLIVISAIDYQFHFIPNKILLFLLIAGIMVNLFFQTISWIEAMTGLIFSSSIMLMIRILGNCLLLQESMGMGDIKFAALLGFYTGWQHFLWALFFGSLLALIITVILSYLKNESIHSKIPLAPYLSMGTVLSILIGDFL